MEEEKKDGGRGSKEGKRKEGKGERIRVWRKGGKGGRKDGSK